MSEHNRRSQRPHTSTSDSSALLQAARNAWANTDPPDLVKYTTELASALSVTRQSVHAWRRLADAPRRTGGYWSVREWKEFMDKHGLAASRTVDRSTVIGEICTAVLHKIPPRLSRHRLQQLLARIETALRVSLPGSRFRSED